MNLLNIDNHISCTSDSVKLLELYFFIVSVVLVVTLLLIYIYITIELLVVLTYTVVDCIDGKVFGSLEDDDLCCVTGLTGIVCCGCSIISLVVSSLVSCCANNINKMHIIIILNLL